MKYAINLAEDGRVLSATYEQFAAEGMPIVAELPDGELYDYIYSNGTYIFNPIVVAEQVEASTETDI